MSAGGRERRIFPRTGVYLRITYESGGDLKSDFSENISRGGLFIATEERFVLGQRVSVELSVAGSAAKIPVGATVRWIGSQSPGGDEPPRPGVGLEFDELQDPLRRTQLEAVVQAVSTPAPLSPGSRSLRVLIVDPNRYARELFREGLESAAREALPLTDTFSVLEADNGHEALELARDNRFDLYLVELKMPDLDGAELIHRIRRLVTQKTPVFAMSRPYTGDRQDALAAGADLFLPKPIQLKPLINTLKVVLRLELPGADQGSLQ